MTNTMNIQSIYTRSSRLDSMANAYYTTVERKVSEHANGRRNARKVRNIQKRICFVLITLFLLGAGVLIGSSIMNASDLQAAPDYAKVKCYTSIRVDADSSLWSIADQYMTEEYSSKAEYINEIKHINHLKDETIYTGQYLSIPVYEVVHPDL